MTKNWDSCYGEHDPKQDDIIKLMQLADKNTTGKETKATRKNRKAYEAASEAFGIDMMYDPTFHPNC